MAVDHSIFGHRLKLPPLKYCLPKIAPTFSIASKNKKFHNDQMHWNMKNAMKLENMSRLASESVSQRVCVVTASIWLSVDFISHLFLNRSFSFEDSIFILNGIATAIRLCLFVLFVEKSKLYCTFGRLSSFVITYTHVDNGQSDAFVYLENSWFFSFFLLLCALQWINCIYWSDEPVILFMFSFIYYIQWSSRRKAAGFWWEIFTRCICGAGATLMELSFRMMIEVVFSQWRCHFQWKKKL